MKKIKKILLIVFTILFGLIFLVVLYLSSSNSKQNSTDVGELPSYVLQGSQEAVVKEFVKNFINLYNSYRYNDYSNLSSLGDFQTVSFQEQTIEKIKNLEKNTPENFIQISEVNLKTFDYNYPNAKQLIVTVEVLVKTGNSSSEATKKFLETLVYKAKIELTPFNNSWLVNQLEINKK